MVNIVLLSEESQAIRRNVGEFLQELSFVNRRWIRIDSCSNNTFNKPTTAGETKEVDCPIEPFSDLLGITVLQKRLMSFSAQPSLWSETEGTTPWALTKKVGML
jgi:hypothetical protein